MLCAQNAAPRQQWTPPMTITPQVAPMANQAFETSQFIFFLKHPTALGRPPEDLSQPLEGLGLKKG